MHQSHGRAQQYRCALSSIGMSLVLVGLMVGVCVVSGCNTPGQQSNLYENVNMYHTHMRWARYNQASVYVSPQRREAFLGRHDELGEDYKIVDVEIKDIRMLKDGDTAESEVVVEWLREPNMTVRKDKITERWKNVDGMWLLVEREVESP